MKGLIYFGLTLSHLLGGNCIKPTRYDNDASYFDYVVVGAGASGSVVAMSLAEKGFQTLLIEAGPDYGSGNVTTPALHVRSSEDPNIAWDFYVKHYPEDTQKRQNVLYPKSSGLGGCTLHNAMIHILPNKRDFDSMVQLTGDSTWSRDNMMNYYHQIARPSLLDSLPPVRALNQFGTLFQGISNFATSLFSEKNKGWLTLSTVNIFNLLADDKKLLDLITKVLGQAVFTNILGFDINNVLFGKGNIDNEATFLVPINVDVSKGMQRVGVLEKLREFKNAKDSKLTIWSDTLVTKVLLDKENKAYGVEYLKGAKLYKAGKVWNKNKGSMGRVFIKREVIVSGGTFNTPQIMMLSGIGDPTHLRAMNIQPKVNLPGVGRNLHDRYEISVNYQFNEDFVVLSQCLMRADINDPCYRRFKSTASGPYTFNGVLTGSTKKSRPGLTEPDTFTLTAPIDFRGYQHGMGDMVYTNKNILSYLILKAHSYNRSGRILLRNDDPTNVPDISFNYFNDTNSDLDLKALVSGIRAVRRQMKSFMSGHKEILPGSQYQTDDQLKQYIKDSAWGHHATGTMKIGKQGDPMAVLDSQFRVKGTTNLRVVDFSIFPDIPGYFPVLYLYMIGAKAADVIAAQATP